MIELTWYWGRIHHDASPTDWLGQGRFRWDVVPTSVKLPLDSFHQRTLNTDHIIIILLTHSTNKPWAQTTSSSYSPPTNLEHRPHHHHTLHQRTLSTVHIIIILSTHSTNEPWTQTTSSSYSPPTNLEHSPHHHHTLDSAETTGHFIFR